MPTLLAYLSQPNPRLDRQYILTGSNTENLAYSLTEGIRPWSDFTLQNIFATFGHVLRLESTAAELPQPAPIPAHLLRVIDESSVTAILLKWNNAIVNWALDRVAVTLAGQHVRAMCWSWGSLSEVPYDNRFTPDWAGIDTAETPYHRNRVPGDTKISGKWSSEMKSRNNDHSTDSEFVKPLRQAAFYSSKVGSRYGYIITDKELYCFRRTISEYEGPSLAASRARRQVQDRGTAGGQQSQYHSHARIASTTSAFSGMSLDSTPTGTSDTRYTDGSNPDVNEGPLEVIAIPWSNSGPNALTINLALFYLHLLAGGDISMQSHYPPLGSARAA